MGGGGFGGRSGEITRKSAANELKPGQGLVPDTIDHISYDPTDNSLVLRGVDGQAVNAAGEQLEDLFFYDLEKVSLKRGSRSYQYLYQFETPYKRTYSWDGQKGSSIFNKIKFKNQTGKPISTAAASMCVLSTAAAT